MKRFAALMSALVLLSFCGVTFGETGALEGRVNSLEATIGFRPPHVQNAEELNVIKNKYIELKAELDSLLLENSNDHKLLFLRGHLQKMGYNFSYPGAWLGASRDFKALLKIDPDNVPALIELAVLWGDNYPALAPEAEKLFRTAQCKYGSEPLETAQRGVFFTLFYQGKTKEAFKQSEYLLKIWPDDEEYKKINGTVRGLLAKKNQAEILKDFSADDLRMASCQE